MKASKILLTCIICFLVVSFTYGQTSYSFNDGLNAAKSSGKKVLLYIYTSSDNWCKKMDSEVFTSDKVKNALSDFIFIKLNAGGSDKYKFDNKEYTSGELAKKFGGTGYPTFAVLNSDGSPISFKYNGENTSSLSGFLGDKDMTEMLNYFTQNKFKDTDISTIFAN